MIESGHRGRSAGRLGRLAAGLFIFIATARGDEPQFGKVSLKTGEAFRATVAKTLSDGYILITPDGLRAVSKDLVSAIAPPGSPEALAMAPPSPPPGKEAPPEGAKVTPAAEPRPDPPSKSPPKPPEATKADASKGPAEKGDAPKGATREIPRDLVPVVILPDKRIDDARAGGPPPVIEIVLAGTIDGKPVNPLDPLTMPRLSFFFSKESQPKFEVLLPPALRQEKSKIAKGSTRPAEYQVRITEDTGMMEVTFYGTSVQRKSRSNLLLELVRASDKKVIVRINAVEDEDGDPEQHERLCRASHEHALKTLVERLKSLKTFGGSSQGSEANGIAPSSAGR
jgi:hypothetical protein